MKTADDKDRFIIAQEAAIQLCDGKRAGVINQVDAAQPKPRPWWRF